MGQAKNRKAEISQLKAGQSLFQFLADSVGSEDIDNKMTALATVTQTLALVANHLPNYTENTGAHISGSQFSAIAQDLENTEDVKYMPKNINSDVYVLSHLQSFYDNGLDNKAFFNTLQYWMGRAMDDWTGVSQFVVLVNDKFGTDQHKESTKIGLFLNYGPIRVIVAENADKSTSLVLSSNESESEEAVA